MIKMNAEDILSRLRAAHPPTHFFFFGELRIGGGFGKDSEQRLDAFSVGYLPSKRNVVKAFEIKVSKQDFKVEISKPLKRRAGMRLSNLFYFICPKGLIPVDEVPLNCGLIEVLEDGRLVETVHAPYRESIPNWNFVASMLRSLDRERLKEWREIQKYIDKDANLQYASIQVLKKRIKAMREYNLGNKEVPDKIAAELEQALFEIQDSVENKLFEGEE